MACVDVATVGGSLSFNGTAIDGFLGISNWDSGTPKQIPVHCAESTAEEYIAGRRAAGTAAADINYDPSSASHVALETAAVAGTVGSLVYTASNGSTITQDAYISNFPFSAADDDIMKGTITFQLSGTRVIA